MRLCCNQRRIQSARDAGDNLILQKIYSPTWGTGFTLVAAVAPSLKHVMTLTKIAAFTLALAGVASAIAVLVTRRRAKRASARGLAQIG